MGRGLAFAGALLVLAVWAQAASACSCVRAHPAGQLAFAPAALVGVVEEVTTGNGGSAHVIRVERAIKGKLPERVTVGSGLTSCQVTLQRGSRVGLLLYGSPGHWETNACSVVDPDLLIATAPLTPPRGTARFVAAVQGESLDSVALGARGRPAGYGLHQGEPLAVAPCGSAVLQAARGTDGKVRVFSRTVPLLAASDPKAVPVGDVLALGCTDRGRTRWVIGHNGDEVELISLTGEAAPRREMRRPASSAAISGTRAYISHEGLFRVIPLTGRRLLRTFRHEGSFEQFTVSGGRVVGRLRDGRGAVLDLRTGRFTTGSAAGALVWLTRDRVLDAAGGVVLDARLRPVRRVTVSGSVHAVEDGAAYLVDGTRIRRLAPGATRARAFATLPGRVVALTGVRAVAGAAWHSCEKSANSPLTT